MSPRAAQRRRSEASTRAREERNLLAVHSIHLQAARPHCVFAGFVAGCGTTTMNTAKRRQAQSVAEALRAAALSFQIASWVATAVCCATSIGRHLRQTLVDGRVHVGERIIKIQVVSLCEVDVLCVCDGSYSL